MLIVGTGAMASLFAARLASKTDVTMLGSWEPGLRAMRDRGVRLHLNGEFQDYPVHTATDATQVDGAEAALVLVKSWQTGRAAEMLSECLAPNGIALTLQNGHGNIERLTETLGERRATLGVTTIGATLLGPGEVRAGGDGPIHVAQHPGLEPAVSPLEEAGFEVKMAEDLQSLLWGKLAINAGINALTALLEVPNGELLRRPEARSVMSRAAREAAAVAKALGIELPYDDAGIEAENVARSTASNNSSMLQDIRRGAPTEIDAINGAVAREGELAGVPVEVNRTLWELVKAKVDQE